MNVKEFKLQMMTYGRRMGEAMNGTFGPACENLGLTHLQLKIVMELYLSKAHTIGSLADDMLMAKANMSTMCKKMEKMGLVKRSRDKADERVVLVRLTEAGKEIGAQIEDSLIEKISRATETEDDSFLDDIILGFEKFTIMVERIIESEQQKERKEN